MSYSIATCFFLWRWHLDWSLRLVLAMRLIHWLCVALVLSPFLRLLVILLWRWHLGTSLTMVLPLRLIFVWDSTFRSGYDSTSCCLASSSNSTIPWICFRRFFIGFFWTRPPPPPPFELNNYRVFSGNLVLFFCRHFHLKHTK